MAAPHKPLSKHGGLRGLPWHRTHPLAGPESLQFEGHFGRMFGKLPPARFTDAPGPVLTNLAKAMTVRKVSELQPDQPDPEENPGISAGYTYLGQFITHDLSFDPASIFQKQTDANEIVDYRTPRFDLDCLYGRGPHDEPYLYRADQKTFLLGDPLTGNVNDKYARDVPRNRPPSPEPARAVIAEPRNDENVIVCQLHASMLRFHNLMAEKLPPNTAFEEIQQAVRWHYQWIVLHDYLPTVLGAGAWESIWQGGSPQLKFFRWRNQGYMPVEFSGAAFRFGHSMIRPVYRLNAEVSPLRLSDLLTVGYFPRDWAMDRTLFFDFGGAPETGPKRVQPSTKIGTSVLNALEGLTLPDLKAMLGDEPKYSLAHLDLLRGVDLALPSGQDVARWMGETPIEDELLKIGKTTWADLPTNPTLESINPIFKDNAPLWVYVLAEAQQQFRDDGSPIWLGPVGGRIVGEVIVGLMMADGNSFLNAKPDFKPREDLRRNGQFKMADLLRAVADRPPQP